MWAIESLTPGKFRNLAFSLKYSGRNQAQTVTDDLPVTGSSFSTRIFTLPADNCWGQETNSFTLATTGCHPRGLSTKSWGGTFAFMSVFKLATSLISKLRVH